MVIPATNLSSDLQLPTEELLVHEITVLDNPGHSCQKSQNWTKGHRIPGHRRETRCKVEEVPGNFGQTSKFLQVQCAKVVRLVLFQDAWVD